MSTNRFILENIASRVLGSAIPPYWHVDKSSVRQVNPDSFSDIQYMSDRELEETIRANALGIPMTMPLQIARTTDPKGTEWTLPVEPTISLTGKNVIVKRRVSKGETRGSIKEKWTQDDYTITISGILMDLTQPDKYPFRDVQLLKDYCESANLSVISPLLHVFGISQIVVEEYDFPFTSGSGNQAYTLKACSDDVYKLLQEGDDLIYT